MQSLSTTLLNWYHKNKRDLPWRHSSNPYEIWLSEIILQQTRVAQGLPYYLRFIENYPNVHSLAAAPEEELLKLWQGLGYYSRARNLHNTAKLIVKKYDGRFPESYDAIRNLKGIGDYTAAAIASFSWNLPYPVLDGNVYRVLSRLFAISEPINQSSSRAKFLSIATELMPEAEAASFNQAMMEFGALQCTPKNPDCTNCPLASSCKALALGIVNELPVKLKKTAVKERYFNYLVAVKDQNTYIRKRLDDDIWKHLYEFPMIESDSLLNEEKLLYRLKELSSEKFVFEGIIHEDTHQLSHRKIRARFFKISPAAKKFFTNSDIFEVKIPDLQSKFALPRLIDRFCVNHLYKNKTTKHNVIPE